MHSPPQSITASGAALPLHPLFEITTASVSPRLHTAIRRHTSNVAPAVAAAAAHVRTPEAQQLRELQLVVASADESLAMATNYSYALRVAPATATSPGTAVVSCASVYGCMYGMESFAQLLHHESGTVIHSTIELEDSPDFAWRGLMVDAGRRFFPMDTLHDLLTTMAANKLNVLHLHASDFCRFGVESKLFPNLTQALTGVKGGFYTQADIKALIAFAGGLGIRIVPEFDIPGTDVITAIGHVLCRHRRRRRRRRRRTVLCVRVPLF